jgi:hypothetical protein
VAFAANTAQNVTFPLIKVFQITGGDGAAHAIPHGFGKVPLAWIVPVGATNTAQITAIDATNVTVNVSVGTATLFISPETN